MRRAKGSLAVLVGVSMSDPLKESDPRGLGDYAFEGRLGEGGMGTVYLARTPTGEARAIKVLHADLSGSQELRARLDREATVLKRLRGDRSAAVYEVNTTAERPYLVMEYVRGLSLDKYVEKNEKLSGVYAWAVMDALLEATEMFHAEGITHRDLKPSNVMLGEDGVKIIDFGISGLVGSSLTDLGSTPVTALWSSPEQMKGAEVGQASDIFNLGMIFAYAWTGKHPFGADKRDAVMHKLMNEEPNLEGVPSRLHPLISECLRKNPTDRPTVAQLRVSLRSISRSSSGSNSGSSGSSVSGQSTGTMIVDVQSRIDEDSERQKTNALTISRSKTLAGVAAAIVAITIALAVVGSRSDTEEQAVGTSAPEISTEVATTTAKSFGDFFFLPEDATVGGYSPAALQIDLSDNARHKRNGAGRVFDLRWMAINCRRNNAEQAISVQLDVAGAPDSRYERAREIALRHVSELLKSEGRLLSLQVGESLSGGRPLEPIDSSIPSDAAAATRNEALYKQFGSPEGIRPLRIILSPYSAQELDAFYAEGLVASRAEQGFVLKGDDWPNSLRVDYGWSIAATRKLGWKGPKVIDAAAVTIAKEQWEGASDEQLLLLISRAILVGLGASVDKAPYSLLSIGSDGQFLKQVYSYSAADRDIARTLGLEDEPPCR